MEEIEQIYRKYTPQVYKFLFSLCHDKYLAEELTQETFFQAMKSIDKFRGDCRIYVWLCSIAKHLWYELWFTGSSDKNKSYLKVFGKKKIGNSESSKSSWEGEVDRENPYQYIFEFSDKIVTIENGKVINEEDK